MPTIRIDDDVYEVLRKRGKTGDTFSDVIRPLVGLPDPRATPDTLAPEDVRELVKALDGVDEGDAMIEAFLDVISGHLPPNWADGQKRAQQILWVVVKFLAEPAEHSIAERHNTAAKWVADRYGVALPTVHDKCARQLYGTSGAGLSEFRRALEHIENDWKQRRTGAGA